jgi:hypothetical protein
MAFSSNKLHLFAEKPQTAVACHMLCLPEMMPARITFVLILALISFSTLAADEKDPFSPSSRRCALRLAAVPMETVIKAAQQSELSGANLKRAEKILLNYFTTIPVFTDRAMLAHPKLRGKLDSLFTSFSGAVSARVVGLDGKADEFIRSMLQIFRSVGVTEITKAELLHIIISTTEDPEVYRPFSMANFILQNRPSLEYVFMNLYKLVPGVEKLEFPGVEYNGPFAIGPRQMEVVRSALQYSQTRPEDHMLEIGYGTPSTLVALSYFTNASKLVGVDPFVIPARANDVLKTRNIELIQGLFPDSEVTMARVRSQGPFSVILALDTLKPDLNVLETSKSPFDHAKALAELLTEGGVAIIMNDFTEPPFFSQGDAIRAGLQVVRWANPRPLPPALMQIMPYTTKQVRAGIMGLTVLRKGQIRQDRLDLLKVTR